MSPIISVENLGKCYRIRHESGNSGGYRRLSEEILAYPRQLLSHLSFLATRFSRIPNSQLSTHGASREDFWALKDICFKVQPGEVLGIIGRNGAGKSTLLKLLSRITEPTVGRIELNGRVASLLEVGTGFHPELTGRENIFLNGAILGMTREEIRGKFDEIVAFAEVERFLDTPVKRYSSGMYVRLAFAIAAHLDPEVLVVDEVLAVGDIAFQKKCLGKMGDIASNGRTVLLVSHNLQTIKSLCTTACYLRGGSLVCYDEPSTVIAAYCDDITPEKGQSDSSSRLGTGEARFISVEPEKYQFDPAEEKRFRFKIQPPTQASIKCSLSALIVDSSNRAVCQCDSRFLGVEVHLFGDVFEGELTLATPWLKPGDYTADFFLVSCGVVDRFERACHFQVLPMLPYSHPAPDAAMTAGDVLGDFNWIVDGNPP